MTISSLHHLLSPCTFGQLFSSPFSYSQTRLTPHYPGKNMGFYKQGVEVHICPPSYLWDIHNPVILLKWIGGLKPALLHQLTPPILCGTHFSSYLTKPHFQCIIYIISKLCCWYLYIEPAVKIHTGQEWTIYSPVSSSHTPHFYFSQILLSFSSSCFTSFFHTRKKSSGNVHQRCQGERLF